MCNRGYKLGMNKMVLGTHIRKDEKRGADYGGVTFRRCERVFCKTSWKKGKMILF